MADVSPSTWVKAGRHTEFCRWKVGLIENYLGIFYLNALEIKQGP